MGHGGTLDRDAVGVLGMIFKLFPTFLNGSYGNKMSFAVYVMAEDAGSELK